MPLLIVAMLAIYVFGAGQLLTKSFVGAAVRSQEVAAEKVKAVNDYIGTKLASGTFWECGSDLENDIDLYLPTSGNGSEYSNVYIRLANEGAELGVSDLDEIDLHSGSR